jgi:hypothetical protein
MEEGLVLLSIECNEFKSFFWITVVRVILPPLRRPCSSFDEAVARLRLILHKVSLQIDFCCLSLGNGWNFRVLFVLQEVLDKLLTSCQCIYKSYLMHSFLVVWKLFLNLTKG